MSEAVSDIIAARSQQTDRLGTMVVWSSIGHAALLALLLLWPDASFTEPPRTIMTVSLGGAPGPKTGGLTEIGGRAVQQAAPETAKPVEAPPAPQQPKMTIPDPKSKPKLQPKVASAPPEATSRTASTGDQPREGTARTETRVRGTGFGLSSAGGSGGPIQLDVSDFCCPEYIDQMRVIIQRTWDGNQGIVGSTGVKFTILRNGTIQMPQVERPSGFVALDNAALRALQLSMLPPLPNEFQNPSLTVHMRFDYQR